MASPLRERASASDVVAEVIASVRAGRDGALFVESDAGLGKTSLLEWARQRAQPDLRVGLDHGDAMEMSLPFGLFDQALSMLDGPRLLTGSGAPTGRPQQLYRLLRWRLEALARHDGAPLPMERASTLLAHGDMLRRTGGPARARSMPA